VTDCVAGWLKRRTSASARASAARRDAQALAAFRAAPSLPNLINQAWRVVAMGITVRTEDVVGLKPMWLFGHDRLNNF
jgi:hypothetical protein